MLLSHTVAPLLFLRPALTLNTRQQKSEVWKVPAGRSADFSETFVCGQRVALSWGGYNCSRQDLWLTSLDYDQTPYSKLVKGNINASLPGDYPWTVDVPATQLARTAKYVFRLKPARDDGVYDRLAREAASPAFLIIQSAGIVQPQTLLQADLAGITVGMLTLLALVALIAWLVFDHCMAMRTPACRRSRSRERQWPGFSDSAWNSPLATPEKRTLLPVEDTYNVPGVYELYSPPLSYPSPKVYSPNLDYPSRPFELPAAWAMSMRS